MQVQYTTVFLEREEGNSLLCQASGRSFRADVPRIPRYIGYLALERGRAEVTRGDR